MSAKRRRTSRDLQRRSLGQNFLVDRSAIDRLLREFQVEPGQLIVEVGAGTGALTLPLARAGARVLAVETDRVWSRQLSDRIRQEGLAARVKTIRKDFRDFWFPAEPFRVVSNPPFGLTTELLSRLLDDPRAGPWRADLLIQAEVARKRATSPPNSLRSAAWSPWWTFRLGPRVRRRSFRPVPNVDTSLLVVERREQPVLPEWLAPQLRSLLRPGWDPPR